MRGMTALLGAWIKIASSLSLAFCLIGFAEAQVKIGTIGDSITEGLGLSSGQSYPARLQALLGSGYTVQNAGISARTLLYKGDIPYITNNDGKLAKLFDFKPDIVTIALGTNDTKPQNWDAHKGEFKHDYLALIDSINTLSPKPRVFLVLPPPIFPNTYSIRDSALVKILAIIREIAAERGLPIIDCNAPLKPFQAYFGDGVHPNATGADSMAHIFQRSIAGPVANRFQSGSYASKEGTLPYRIFMPENYSRAQKYPLILSLHGAGERGNNNVSQIAVHRLAETWAEDSTQRKQKSFVVAPQCPANQQWVDVAGWDKVYTNTAQMAQSAPLTLAGKLVDSLVKALPIDTNRIYVTGISMGGYGTWDLITRYPGKFAAAIPMSGGCDTSKSSVLKSLPIWTFHGAVDGVVPPNATRSMVAKFKASGESVLSYTAKYSAYFSNATVSRADLTVAIDAGAKKLYGEYTDGSHDIWSDSYDDPLLARWLFKQIRQPNASALESARRNPERGPRSLLILPGGDVNLVSASLPQGKRYALRITDVKGSLLATAEVRGGSPLPAGLAERLGHSQGVRRVLIRNLD
jgi:lysophospholipase L1-like esterase/poly(3-hydroxybutyrate) depolymerase